MKKNYTYAALLSTFIAFNLCYGQSKQLKSADKEFKQFNYIDAQKTYLDVVEKGFVSQDIFEKLGDSYYYNAEYSKASKWYSKLYYDYKDSTKPEYFFRYSHTLKSIGQYDTADEVMKHFNQITGNEEIRSKHFDKKLDYLDLIDKQSGKFNVVNLPINSSASDFGPSFMRDDFLIFASSRRSGGSKVVHEWSKEPFLDLYSSRRDSKNTMGVQGAGKIKGDVNTKLHESSTVFTRDGKTMYFTRNNYTKKKRKTNTDGTTLLKLYKATLLPNGKWDKIKELPFNSNNYSVAHPALSPDEKRLYFASDMPGTYGLSDIFYVDILGDNIYGEPVNLGKRINTEARETFPFISKEGKLYFASDGHVGLGGLDVFVAKSFGKKFNTPYNVGKPVNSPKDDFSFILDADTKIGYFTSNRDGGKGDDDIYSFIQTGELIESCKQYLSGVITDAETREKLPGAKVTLFDSRMRELESTIADINAKYKLPITCNETYVIRASKNDYKKTEIDFFTTNDFEYKHDKPLQLRKGSDELGVVEAKLGDDLGKLLKLNPIYFDFDKYYIRPDAEIELQKVISVMREYPALKIDVRSHTDSRAPYNYNITLSSNRNRETIKYIVEKGGISKSRLTGRGYGETQPVNGCADGVDCNEDEHQLNRRSEFIIVEK